MFEQQFRVYYEDTDAGGVVYHANYLKFAERARTELLRSHGIDQSRMWEEKGVGFVVRRAEISYIRPARLDDLITVKTGLQETANVRMTLRQEFWREETMIAELVVDIVSVGKDFRPVKIPPELVEIF